MDPFIMKTVGEEWARDRQQRRRERELQHANEAPMPGTGGFMRDLGSRVMRLARNWTWGGHAAQPMYAQATGMPEPAERVQASR